MELCLIICQRKKRTGYENKKHTSKNDIVVPLSVVSVNKKRSESPSLASKKKKKKKKKKKQINLSFWAIRFSLKKNNTLRAEIKCQINEREERENG